MDPVSFPARIVVRLIGMVSKVSRVFSSFSEATAVAASCIAKISNAIIPAGMAMDWDSIKLNKASGLTSAGLPLTIDFSL